MQFDSKILKGFTSRDHRGSIHFVNQFDMLDVRRFYIIEHNNTSIVRGWRGHKIEQRWFKVLNGKFIIKVVKIDHWENPSVDLFKHTYKLTSDDESVLYVSNGHATSIQALTENSKLLVFADSLVEDAGNDDYLFPLGHFE